MTLNVAREACKTEVRKFVDLFRPPPVQPGGCVFCAYEIEGGRGPCPTVTRAAFAVPTFRGSRDLCMRHGAPFFVPRCGTLPAADSFYAAVQARALTDGRVFPVQS